MLGYYTLSPMSHSATFMMASAFMLVWWKVKDSSSLGGWALLGLCGGLPLDLPLAGHLLPRHSDALEISRSRILAPWRRWSRVWRSRRALLDPADRGVEGHLRQALHIPQGKDFLHFPPQYMHLVLFSTNHGWFIWTPITALGVLGLFYGARKSAAFYWPCLLVNFLEVAVMGSMPTNWHNSESFGIRSLTSCVP